MLDVPVRIPGRYFLFVVETDGSSNHLPFLKKLQFPEEGDGVDSHPGKLHERRK